MMGSPTQDVNGNHQDRSDLMQIRGIGAVRKRWLHSLGIDTIAALAQASAAAIEAQAKGEGRTLSHDEVAAWIAQAQVHPVQASLEQAESSYPVAAIALANDSVNDPVNDSANDSNDSTVAAARAEAAGEPCENWESIASFNVHYQRRQIDGTVEQRLVAHHLEADAIETWVAFETNETERLQQWLRDRLENRPPLPTEAPIAAGTIAAEITQLRVLQPHHMARPAVANPNHPIFATALQPAKPFALEVSLCFTALLEIKSEIKGEIKGDRPIAYEVECLVRHLSTGVTDRLGTVTAHFPLAKHSTATVFLPSLVLPQSGTYRLTVLAKLQHAPAPLGQFKVPMLQVV